MILSSLLNGFGTRISYIIRANYNNTEILKAQIRIPSILFRKSKGKLPETHSYK